VKQAHQLLARADLQSQATDGALMRRSSRIAAAAGALGATGVVPTT
jgi:hypothetical protein